MAGSLRELETHYAMKKVYVLTIAFAAAGAFAFAEEQSATQLETPEATRGVLLQKGFIKRGNEVFKLERVTRATKLEGIEVDAQGNIMKDGKRIELKEGQMVSPEGQVTESPVK